MAGNRKYQTLIIVAGISLLVSMMAGNAGLTHLESSYVTGNDVAWLIKVSNVSIGDINGDNIVDYKDLGLLGASYGLSLGDAGYNANADLNNDGTVDYKDLGILGAHYGEKISSGLPPDPGTIAPPVDFASGYRRGDKSRRCDRFPLYRR